MEQNSVDSAHRHRGARWTPSPPLSLANRTTGAFLTPSLWASLQPRTIAPPLPGQPQHRFCSWPEGGPPGELTGKRGRTKGKMLPSPQWGSREKSTCTRCVNAGPLGVTIREGREVGVKETLRCPECFQGGSEGFREEVGSCGSEGLERTWGLEERDGHVRRGQSSV